MEHLGRTGESGPAIDRMVENTDVLSGASPQEAVNPGWAHGALLTTFPGDTTTATAEQVRAFAGVGSARIQR